MTNKNDLNRLIYYVMRGESNLFKIESNIKLAPNLSMEMLLILFQ